MRNKKIKIFFVFLVLASLVGVYLYKTKQHSASKETLKEIQPFIGDIKNEFSTTGTVLPKNRLEIKPPVSGRVDEILVEEGNKVKKGQTIAWMSSTERAVLLDAATGQGEKALEYWKQVYKAIPLISPIDGEVIVATTQPGQTVTTSDAVIVLSDELIVRAQVDETDIGKVKLGQEVTITLDAYQDQVIEAKVEHIYYESKTVNNVTIYEVDLLAQNSPAFFRSGMNASINFVEQSRKNILLVPVDALLREKEGTFVLVKTSPNDTEGTRREVKLGISDNKNTEVISGITKDDIILVKSTKYTLPKDNNTGTNPFMPQRRR